VLDSHPHLRIHSRNPASRSNGPGLRSVIWTQGCTLACPGCFNPESHLSATGETTALDILASWVFAQAPAVEGLTISGGEPFQQAAALAEFLSMIRSQSDLSVIVFTGYTQNELARIPAVPACLESIDILIAGRYVASRRQASGLLGSSNKTAHFLSGRYQPADLANLPEAELWILPDGSIQLSGINPLQW